MSAQSHPQIQYVSDEDGQPVSVLVPIELWHEITSERETAYLLKSEAMKKRLLAAKDRQEESPLTTPARSLDRVSDAFEDLSYWVNHDRKQALRMIRLIQETQTAPSAVSVNPNRSLRWSWLLVEAH